MTEKKLSRIIAQFMERQNKINEEILTKIGETIKAIGTLKPSQVQKIRQMITYGGDLDEITQLLANTARKTKQEIFEIYKQVAESDYEDAKYLYQLQSVPQVPFNENKELAKVISAVYETTSGLMSNLARTKAVGFVDNKGRFLNLHDVYNEAVDKAVQTISTIGSDFPSEMFDYLKQLGESGVRVVYESNGKQITRRLDTALRMHILDSVRDIRQAVQDHIGKEIGADGVEISAHLTCAPDHLPYQGLQYSKEEFEELQNKLERRIGEYNCRHICMAIVLGGSEPTYTPEELEQIRKSQTEKSIEYEGKKYTQYEATQVQRKLETKIRKYKDQYILARAAGNEQLMLEANRKLNIARAQYRNFSKASDLPKSRERTRVVGFKNNSLTSSPFGGKISNRDFEFTPAKTIEEADAYAKNVLGIKNVSYKGVDVFTANEWNRGLADSFSRFPELKNSFGFVGTCQERNRLVRPEIKQHYINHFQKEYPYLPKDYIEILAEEKTKQQLSWLKVSSNVLAQYWSPPKFLNAYRGVTVNDFYGRDSKKFLEVLKENVKIKFHPVGCDTIRSLLDHEIGHELDRLLNLRNHPEIKSIFHTKTPAQLTEELSKYAWSNGDEEKYAEMIAEAWAEYCNNPNPREIAKTIGKLIESEYKKKYGGRQ